MPFAVGGVREKWGRGIDCPARTMRVEGLRERLQQLRCRALAASAESDHKENSSRSVSAHFTPPKAAAEDDHVERQTTYQHRQLSYHRQAADRCVRRRKCLIFNVDGRSPTLARTKLVVEASTVPSRHGA